MRGAAAIGPAQRQQRHGASGGGAASAAAPQRSQRRDVLRRVGAGASAAPVAGSVLCPHACCSTRRRGPLLTRAGADAHAFEGLLGGSGGPIKRHAPSPFTAAAGVLGDPATLQQQQQQQQQHRISYAEDWARSQQQQQQQPYASAAPASASAASPTGSLDDGDAALLPPILPLHGGVTRFAWAAPDGTPLEVLHRPGAPPGAARDGGGAAGAAGGAGGGSAGDAGGDAGSDSIDDGALRRPPIVFIHGLFRGAWCFDEALMPALASAGYDCYALSLRGQGSSGVGAPGGAAGVIERRGGVPLGVNLADIAAFVGSLEAPVPPVLVGHSLGGTFVQEYLARLAEQQQPQHQQQPQGAPAGSDATPEQVAAASESGPPLPRLPPLSGAVALASACAGTVMAFKDFVADVGLAEFVCQMGVVFTGAHLRSAAVARYCWWPRAWPAERLERYHTAVQASSRVAPYVASEIAAWAPDPYGSEAAQAAAAADRTEAADGASAEAVDAAESAAAEGKGGAAAGARAAAAAARGPPVALPPVLAVGGADDRVIRPFQIEAFAPRWRARARVLPGVTHDLMLGPQALRVAVELLAWLESPPGAAAAAEAAAAARRAAAAAGASKGDAGAEAAAADAAAARAAVAVLPLHQGLAEPGIGSRPVLGEASGSGSGASGGGVVDARQPLARALSV